MGTGVPLRGPIDRRVPVQLGGIYLSVEWLGVSVLWGSLATSAIIPATNFVVMNFWVFSEDLNRREPAGDGLTSRSC